LERIGSVQDREIRQADLVRVAIDDRGQAEEVGGDGVVANLELEVAAVIEFRPLEFAVVVDQVGTGVVGARDCDVLACW